MKQIGNIWYVPFADLTERCGLSPDTLKQGVSRGLTCWESMKDPSDARKRLIRYDTMAGKYQMLVQRVLLGGYEPTEWHERQKRQAPIQTTYTLPERLEQACERGYSAYLGLYEVRTGDQQRDQRRIVSLARAAAVVEVIGNYVNEKGSNWRSYEIFNEAAAWLQENAKYYLHAQDVPTSAIRLKAKVVERFVDGKAINSVVARVREGNANREGRDNTTLTAWFVQARMAQTNVPTAKIIRHIRTVALAQGIDCPSDSWFSQLAVRPDIKRMTEAPGGRFGHSDNRALHYTGYLPTKGALFAGDCWQVDATRVNFLPHMGADGKAANLTIIAIRDVATGEIVGSHYQAGGEDHKAYHAAFKMAMTLTGYTPYQIICDKFPGHNTGEMGNLFDQLRALGTTITIGHKATDKAAVERWFSTFQSEFLSESQYYYGEGIKSTRAANHRSAEWLAQRAKELKHEGWDIHKAWMEANHHLQRYRNTPRNVYAKKKTESGDLSPAQLHAQSDKPFVIALRPEKLAEIFQLGKVLKIVRNTVTVGVYDTKYHYTLPYEILSRHKELMVRYDSADMSTAWCYDAKTGEFLDVVACQDPAILTGPGAEWGKLQKHKTHEADIRNKTRQALEDTISAAPDLGTLLRAHAPKPGQETAQDRWLEDRMPELIETRTANKGRPPKPIVAQAVAGGDVDLGAFYDANY